MGTCSQVLLVFFDTVSGDSVWMMMLPLPGCVDRITGNRPVCFLTDVSATAASMAFTTRTPWSEELFDPSQRGSPGCLMPNLKSAGGAWKEDVHWQVRLSFWTALILSIFSEICGCQDEIFTTWNPQSSAATCRLPAGGQLSIIACRTGTALSLHRRLGWGARYELKPSDPFWRDRSWQYYPSICLFSFAESVLHKADWVM